MFSDEYLDYWGAVYVAARLLERGILFHQFLEDPRGYLKTVGLSCAPLCIVSGFRPLLPRQKRVARTFWKRCAPHATRIGPAIPKRQQNRLLAEAEDANP